MLRWPVLLSNFVIVMSTTTETHFSSFLPTREQAAERAFKAASYLSDPICKTRELYYRIKFADVLNPEMEKTARWANNFWLSTQMVTCGAIATFSTLPGIALRALGEALNPQAFLHKTGNAAEKLFQRKTFTMLSWNICCVPAGYSITDGNVFPWPERMSAIIDSIKKSNADVVCLYEVFDTQAGFALYEGLKEEYAHFYLNIGTQAMGAPSGIFVASKYKIDDPQFVRFSKDSLVGRTKYAAKGVFSFDITMARIFATHLQHSEVPNNPTEEEKQGRAAQMRTIISEIEKKSPPKPTIVTGDLNLNSEEYKASEWQSSFEGEKHFEEPTWKGDTLCAQKMNKTPSHPQNLDFTMAYKNEQQPDLDTLLTATNFDPTCFKKEALSDHHGLFTTVNVKSK